MFDDLKKKGYRITPQRIEVFKEIVSQPRTIEDIYKSLKGKNIRIDLTCIYRNIQLFLQNRLVREVEFGDGKKRYESVNIYNHHHHLICENCGSVEDVPLDEKVLISQIEKQSSFKVDKHNLEFFGFCAGCQ